jgi:hypothetical protein
MEEITREKINRYVNFIASVPVWMKGQISEAKIQMPPSIC